ncbi:cupin domain-containing protein [Sciscionella marina]|uniref:cupin domain-containing protein n=1 Tax=Sciscionella marina TaxID=508770 RepID=UPI001969BA55|nr:cupin domain-containing protein [Sciscionella marina]
MPHVIHMDPKYEPLEHIDVPALARAVTEPWFNQTLCRVNDSVIRLGVVSGEHHWHRHDEEDEFCSVIDGRLIIELDGHDSAELGQGQGITVPRGLRPRGRSRRSGPPCS